MDCNMPKLDGLGATRCVVPSDGELEEVPGVEVIRCRTLAQAIAVAQ